ncbi:pyridoxal phosphate-dependent transferase [Xylaria digitata]|nr:pyridoxal phosphate-dependent transferase [Xylaria digitata]
MKPSARIGSLEATLQGRLARRESQGRLRHLDIPRPGLVDFSSNDYLSLSQDLVLRNALVAHLNGLEKKASSSPLNGRVIGSGGSRLLDGNSAFFEHLERKLSDFHTSEAALLFNSAYDANVGLISCVPGTRDVIMYDSLIHASIHDGMRLSRATKRIHFEHSSIIQDTRRSSVRGDSKFSKTATEPQGLELALKKLIDSDQQVRCGESNVFICVEALYSMDGDITDLEYVSNVVKALLPRGNGHIIVDEAHSVGILGDGGRGLVCQLGLQDQVWARVVGFGKAMGSAGGAILCSSIARLYLINYARTLIYTTAMSFPSLASISAAYDYMISGEADKRRKQLTMLIQYCHDKLKSLDQRLKPSATVLRMPRGSPRSPIIPLFTSYPKSLARHCQISKFMIRPIVAPTVLQGQERVRICLHASNTVEQVDGLCRAIEIWLGLLRTKRDTGARNHNQTGVTAEAESLESLLENMKASL